MSLSQLRALQLAFGTVLLIIVAWFLAGFPILQLPLAAAFCVYALGLLLWPRLWLVALPALLPVFDLAPLSGRFFFDEFDALVLLTTAILLLRGQHGIGTVALSRQVKTLAALLTVSYLISASIPLLNLPPVTPDSFANYLSPYNGLRVAKGILWSLLLLWPLQRAIEQNVEVRELLCAGFLIGLLGVSIIGLYERTLFAGALTWNTDYRISSSFSSMHTGDGPIDVWLTTTIPMLGIFLIDRRWRLHWPLAIVLGLLSLYALVATGSRGPTIGVAIAFTTGLLALAATRDYSRRGVAAAALSVTAVLFIAAAGFPVLAQTALGQRFFHAPRDAVTRFDHWVEALKMRSNTVPSQLFGMGLGSFPRIFQENTPVRSGRYTYIDDGKNIFLRLWSGLNLYMGQVVTIYSDSDYELAMRFRTREPNATLTVSACELWMLESRNCTVADFALPQSDEWQTLNRPLHTTDTGSGISIAGMFFRRPTWLTFYASNATAAGVDIGGVSLKNSNGQELIQNADFRQGADSWFWVHDDHSSWHTLNLVVDVLFNQGWFGLLALGALFFSTLFALARRIAGGDGLSAVLLAALVGFSVTGITVSALDEPRITLAFCLLCFAVLCEAQWARVRAEGYAPAAIDRDGMNVRIVPVRQTKQGDAFKT